MRGLRPHTRRHPRERFEPTKVKAAARHCEPYRAAFACVVPQPAPAIQEGGRPWRSLSCGGRSRARTNSTWGGDFVRRHDCGQALNAPAPRRVLHERGRTRVANPVPSSGMLSPTSPSRIASRGLPVRRSGTGRRSRHTLQVHPCADWPFLRIGRRGIADTEC